MDGVLRPEARLAPAGAAGHVLSSRLMKSTHLDSHQVRSSLANEDLYHPYGTHVSVVRGVHFAGNKKLTLVNSSLFGVAGEHAANLVPDYLRT